MWAIGQDVIDSWIGPGAPTSPSLVQTWVDRAERLLRVKVPDLETRITAGDEPDLRDAVVDVVVSMVTRIFRNPQGYRQINVTTGPFSEGGTVGGDNPGSLYVTDDELAQLRTAETRVGSGAFEVDPLIGYELPWSPLNSLDWS